MQPDWHLVNKAVLLMMLDSLNTEWSAELNAVAAHLLFFFSLRFPPQNITSCICYTDISDKIVVIALSKHHGER